MVNLDRFASERTLQNISEIKANFIETKNNINEHPRERNNLFRDDSKDEFGLTNFAYRIGENRGIYCY